MEKIAYIVPSETMVPIVEGILQKEINAGRLDVLVTMACNTSLAKTARQVLDQNE